jgi:hypothetical protein
LRHRRRIFQRRRQKLRKTPRPTPAARYGIKFVDEKSVMFIIEAMQGCDSGNFAIGSTCDFILIISSSGRIERLLQGRPSAFAQCIFSHLHKPKTVARPPSDHWALHIRIYHGSPPRRPDPLIMYSLTMQKPGDRPNKSLQPTATRCAFTFFMTKTVLKIISLASGSRG